MGDWLRHLQQYYKIPHLYSMKMQFVMHSKIFRERSYGLCLLRFLFPNLASTPPPLQFSPRLTQTSVRETFVAGGFPRPAEGFVVVRCIDSIGVPTSGAVNYSIVDNDPGPFLFNATTGRLSVTADLDYET